MPYDPLAWERRLYLVQTKTQRVPGERLDVRFSCFFVWGIFSIFNSWGVRRGPGARGGNVLLFSSPPACRFALTSALTTIILSLLLIADTAGSQQERLSNSLGLREQAEWHTHIYRTTTTSKGRKRQSHRLLVIPPLPPHWAPAPSSAFLLL